MDFNSLMYLMALAALVTLILSLLGLVIVSILYFAKRRRMKKSRSPQLSPVPSSSRSFFSLFGGNESDITTYETSDIPKSGLFSAHERQMEYRRRGKSPSGVIDGVYNDMYREYGEPYNDANRDWDADA